MFNEIQTFLNRHQLDADQVAKISGLSKKELLHLGEPFNTINLRIVHALGMINDYPPEKVVQELIEIHGDPIINFIEQHPRVDHQLVSKVENLMIDLATDDISTTNVSFNRYYHEGLDTDERAEQCLRNIYRILKEQKQVIDDYRKDQNE